MAISPKIELRQGQSLVMTPQLQQAIKLLQLSNLDLAAFVEQELERNPLLERAEADSAGEAVAAEPESDRGGDSGGDGDDGGDGGSEADAALSQIDLDRDSTVPAAEAALDVDYDNSFSDSGPSDSPAPQGLGDNYISGRGGSSHFDDDENSLERSLSRETSLRDHLLEQLQMVPLAPAQRLIGRQLIDLVDAAGYLTEPLADTAARLGCSIADVEKVLKPLQGFDPTGVFARDLADCLALQLKERDRLDPAMQALLRNLELVARRDMAGLMKLCGVDAEDLADMLRELRALNPKPGLIFDHEATQTVIADVIVRKLPDGSWHVELNSDTLPRVLVNTRYHARVLTGSREDKTAKAYISECLNSANWLVKSLDQRANTILKVASEIVRQQDAFLTHGVRQLRPLNLRAIAEAIGMHESTVSRVTSNKYMTTPRGIFELKYFFTAAIASTDGAESFSAEAVRHRIRELVDREGPNDVLSDDRIVETLARAGIDIARRTVAKYRESLHIPSSVERRRMKKISA